MPCLCVQQCRKILPQKQLVPFALGSAGSDYLMNTAWRLLNLPQDSERLSIPVLKRLVPKQVLGIITDVNFGPLVCGVAKTRTVQREELCHKGNSQ
jgi:hypothetical protein